MCDTDILETAFIGKSFWNDEENFEDIKEDLPQILLDYYESEGVDPEEMDAETLRELRPESPQIHWSLPPSALKMIMKFTGRRSCMFLSSRRWKIWMKKHSFW